MSGMKDDDTCAGSVTLVKPSTSTAAAGRCAVPPLPPRPLPLPPRLPLPRCWPLPAVTVCSGGTAPGASAVSIVTGVNVGILG
jgi:hypothetical protein